MSAGTLPFHREMKIVPSPCDAGSITTFYCISISFREANKGKKEGNTRPLASRLESLKITNLVIIRGSAAAAARRGDRQKGSPCRVRDEISSSSRETRRGDGNNNARRVSLLVVQTCLK